jgi:hypothetical protein
VLGISEECFQVDGCIGSQVVLMVIQVYKVFSQVLDFGVYTGSGLALGLVLAVYTCLFRFWTCISLYRFKMCSLS